jgi:Histidine kinase
LLALALGAVYGVVHAWIIFFLYAERFKPQSLPGVAAVMHVRWMLLMMGVACGLVFAMALLRDVSRRGAIRPRQLVWAIVGVTAWGAACDPMAVGAAGAVHTWLRVPTRMFTGGVDWITALSRMWGQSMDKVFTLATIVTLSTAYVLKRSRAAGALATAQLGLLETRRRVLAEELRTAQAALDPALLFETLEEIDRRFDHEPQAARDMLDALIRYLRAAIPGTGEFIETLDHQALLMRAWFEIAAIRSDGLLRGEVLLPKALESKPFAPGLVLPLVSLAAGAQRTGAGRVVHVRVTVSMEGNRLVVEVHEDGSARGQAPEAGAVVDALRRRVTTLYGQDAQLMFAALEPRGSLAKIVIDVRGTS